MHRPMEDKSGSLGQRTLSPPDSSLDDLELESCIEELDNLGDLDSGELARKPHFLDYDNKPPAEVVEQHNRLNGASPSAEVEQLDTALVSEPHFTQNGRHAPHGVAGGQETAQSSIPLMNASYDTPAMLGMLPAMAPLSTKLPPSIASRGTWPLKERMNPVRRQQHHSLNRDLAEVGPKMECVYSLLSMLGSTNVLEMSSKFLELSRNEEKCSALRRSGCVPLLVHIIHNEPNDVARKNARHALVNVIRCNVDETSARRELKVLRLIDQLIDYTDVLKEDGLVSESSAEHPLAERQTVQDQERHPIQAIGTLAKISYDEDHRHAMCQFGALQTISSLIQLDHLVHGAAPADAVKCIEMRRYASMVLTNLTFGQGNNKALLCSNRDFMQALVSQLSCTELVQVTASVLRNLSWRADSVTKQTLIEIGTVKILTGAAMRCSVENTLKSILSALWNLSNHCAQNRAKICEVEGALELLIDMLTYDAPSKTMSIVENAGGILRNISSHIAQCEQYRKILREKNCLKILLDQLKSPSLTVVSNACGTLGNISSDNSEDQQFLRDNGAIPMLRSLIYSKHNIISSGSRLALKNLQHRPPAETDQLSEPQSKGLGKIVEPKELPSLNVRKQRAIEQELGSTFYKKKLTNQMEEDVSDEEGIVPGGDDGVVDPSAVHIRLVEDRLVQETELRINYGLQNDMQQQQQQQSSSYDYQETDIDQLTDYSLRYAENQSESDDEKGEAYCGDPVNMLIPEDSVKCYYTEGTPQIISSATSMSDLRVSASQQPQPSPFKQVNALKSNPIPIGAGSSLVVPDDLGCNTPDKPFNYCEEGTPDFSRDASLNIIDRPDQQKGAAGAGKGGPSTAVDLLDGVSDQVVVGLPDGPAAKSVSFLNTAEETPLMFSRTSSMGSLSSAEPACTDDKSSIVSEFSRMASGVISPSELPDSPTQTIAHSPRQSVGGSLASPSSSGVNEQTKGDIRPLLPQKRHQDLQQGHERDREDVDDGKDGPEQEQAACRMAGSAFVDTVSKFNAENTLTQFSCATSLSNLSIEDKEPLAPRERAALVRESADGHRSASPLLPNPADLITVNECTVSDGDSDAGGDDELLASCISIGMNSVKARSSTMDVSINGAPTYANVPNGKALPVATVESPGLLSHNEMLRRYCTETTAARQLSGPTSTGDLSVLTIDSGRDGPDSDDSSNESDNNDRLLEECILSGMPKPKSTIEIGKQLNTGSSLHQTLQRIGPVEKESPFKMMRNPVHLQPLLANDELSPFYVEDSPCNFSTVSALSELTVASDTVPLQTLGSQLAFSLEMDRDDIEGASERNAATLATNPSLSSPSVASNDDNLLEEAIATGAIRKAEMAQHRRRSMQDRPSLMVHAVGKRENAARMTSAGSTETVNSDEEQHDALLQDAIERGMKKGKSGTAARLETERWLKATNAAREPVKSIPVSDRDDDDDYQLLAECIQRGMHTVPKVQPAIFERDPSLQAMVVRARASAMPTASSSMQLAHPKNVHTTPVIPKDVGAAEVSAGVVSRASYRPQLTVTRASPSQATYPSPVNIGDNIDSSLAALNHRSITADDLFREDWPALGGRATPEGGAAPPELAIATSVNGCNRQHPENECCLASITRVLTRSCCRYSTDPKEACSELGPEPISVSNPMAIDRHKDPEQMLKSVERFTRELVSQSGHGRSNEMQATDEHAAQMNLMNGPTSIDMIAESSVGPSEAQLNFQVGGKVSVSAFSLQSGDESLLEFVNLPNLEPPSMVSDTDLLSTGVTPSTRVPFLSQFMAAIEAANINSIEPPTFMAESLASLTSAKCMAASNAEAAGSLPKIFSNLSQTGARCHTPPSAGEVAACVPSAQNTDVVPQFENTQQVTQELEKDLAKEETPVNFLAKGAEDATATQSKRRFQHRPEQRGRSLTKLPKQQKTLVGSPKKPTYESPYGRLTTLATPVRKGLTAPRAPGVQRTAPVANTTPPSVGMPTHGVASGSSILKRKIATPVRPPFVTRSVSNFSALKEPASKQLPKDTRRRNVSAASSIPLVKTPSPSTIKANGQRKDNDRGASAIPLPPSVSKGALLSRQQTFVIEKPTMPTTLPHISSTSASSPKEVKPGLGVTVKAEVPAGANTTVQRPPVAASTPTARASRIPPPPSRISAASSSSVGSVDTRKEGRHPYSNGRNVPHH